MLQPDCYRSMAECIRSGQVPDNAVIAILRENPDFAAWYKARYNL